MGSYRLRCLEGGEYVDDDYTLRCGRHNGLLRAEYDAVTLVPKDTDGVFKFYDWLPVRSVIDTDSAPVAFRNRELGRELGLKDLWIAFTGYYPERGAFVRSCSFKEMEALPTLARIRDAGKGAVVVASAGNTGRAFAQVSNAVGMSSLIVVPKRSADRIWVPEDNGYARLMTVNGDYADSIAVADRISSSQSFIPEGGARNIARRDGMGTVVLESVLSSGKIPEYYFQAVGSGTGAISAWEASLRLIRDGRFGTRLPELHLSQNHPFTPMKNAWDEGRRNINEKDMENAERKISEVYADVLTNRSPPYSPAGGLFDAMTACGGTIRGVTNREAKDAERFWLGYESAVPDPAASVALASLMKAVEAGEIDTNKAVLLNMTGGGRNLVSEDVGMYSIERFAEVDPNISDVELRRIVNG